MIDDSYEIPSGWSMSTIGAVASPVTDKVDPRQFPDLPYLGLEHIEAHTMRLLGKGAGSDVKSTKTRFRAGDVLYGKLRPYLNKVAIPDFGGICSTDILVFRDSDLIDAGYLGNYLNQLWVAERAHHESRGVELPRVDWNSLSAFPIALPQDKRQQTNIVHRVDQARRARASAGGHITTALRAIERFRQSVLAAACSGRLTADWRATKIEPSADSLIKDLKERHLLANAKERKAKVIEASVRDFDASSVPDSWSVSPLKLLCVPGRSITYGILKPGPNHDNGVPYVRVTDFKKGTIALEGLKKTSPDISHEYRRSVLRSGDLLFAIRGTFGHVASVPDPLEGANITQDSARLSIDPIISTEYVQLALREPSTQTRISRAAKGVAVRGINIGDLRELMLPLPPRAEQDEIVRRVERLFSLADSLSPRIAAARRSVERTSQAVLAKAFRGELPSAG